MRSLLPRTVVDWFEPKCEVQETWDSSPRTALEADQAGIVAFQTCKNGAFAVASPLIDIFQDPTYGYGTDTPMNESNVSYRDLFHFVHGNYSTLSKGFNVQIDHITSGPEFDPVIFEDIRTSIRKELLKRRGHYETFLDSVRDLISEDEFQSLRKDFYIYYEKDKRSTSSINQRLKAVAKSFSIRNQPSDKRVSIRAQKKIIFKQLDEEDLVK